MVFGHIFDRFIKAALLLGILLFGSVFVAPVLAQTSTNEPKTVETGDPKIVAARIHGPSSLMQGEPDFPAEIIPSSQGGFRRSIDRKSNLFREKPLANRN